MKIIQLIQKPQLRGAEVFACQLSNELIGLGHRVIIVTVFNGDTPLPFDGRIESLDGIQNSRLLDWKAWKKLAVLIDREKPDLIQANAGDTLKYAVLSKLLFRWRVPLCFRNASTISLYIKSFAARCWNAFLFQFTTHIISVSEFSKDDFVRTFPKAQKKITVVPIGVPSVAARNATELMRSPGYPFLVHIGGFSFEKNHSGLLRIFQRILEFYPAAILGLIGNGPLKEAIEGDVRRLGLSESVVFFGHQMDPGKYLDVSQCLLLPSIIEGMPAVILEAFLHHVPVVAYDVGGIPEIVKSGETGWIIRKNDEASFAAAVCEAITDKEKAHLLALNAARLVEEQYTLSRIALRFLKVYQLIKST